MLSNHIEDVKNININVSSLVQSGDTEIAEAIRRITDAIAESKDITNDQRTELLDQVEELSIQASLPAENRAKTAIIKSVFTGLATSISTAGGLAEVWSTWGQTIRTFFGL